MSMIPPTHEPSPPSRGEDSDPSAPSSIETQATTGSGAGRGATAQQHQGDPPSHRPADTSPPPSRHPHDQLTIEAIEARDHLVAAQPRRTAALFEDAREIRVILNAIRGTHRASPADREGSGLTAFLVALVTTAYVTILTLNIGLTHGAAIGWMLPLMLAACTFTASLLLISMLSTDRLQYTVTRHIIRCQDQHGHTRWELPFGSIEQILIALVGTGSHLIFLIDHEGRRYNVRVYETLNHALANLDMVQHYFRTGQRKTPDSVF